MFASMSQMELELVWSELMRLANSLGISTSGLHTINLLEGVVFMTSVIGAHMNSAIVDRQFDDAEE